MCMYCNRQAKTVKLTESEIEIQFKPALSKADKDAKIQKAYNVLTKAFCKKDGEFEDFIDATAEAIGYLGEVLE